MFIFSLLIVFHLLPYDTELSPWSLRLLAADLGGREKKSGSGRERMVNPILFCLFKSSLTRLWRSHQIKENHSHRAENMAPCSREAGEEEGDGETRNNGF